MLKEILLDSLFLPDVKEGKKATHRPSVTASDRPSWGRREEEKVVVYSRILRAKKNPHKGATYSFASSPLCLSAEHRGESVNLQLGKEGARRENHHLL